MRRQSAIAEGLKKSAESSPVAHERYTELVDEFVW